MEEKLDEVRVILAGANITGSDLDDLRDKLDIIRYLLCISWESGFFFTGHFIYVFSTTDILRKSKHKYVPQSKEIVVKNSSVTCTL